MLLVGVGKCQHPTMPVDIAWVLDFAGPTTPCAVYGYAEMAKQTVDGLRVYLVIA